MGYKGLFHRENRRAFGFMDKTATLRSNMLLENPTIPAFYRLAHKDGAVLNPYEKHMAEGIEMLARFVGRNESVLCRNTPKPQNPKLKNYLLFICYGRNLRSNIQVILELVRGGRD